MRGMKQPESEGRQAPSQAGADYAEAIYYARQEYEVLKRRALREHGGLTDGYVAAELAYWQEYEAREAAARAKLKAELDRGLPSQSPAMTEALAAEAEAREKIDDPEKLEARLKEIWADYTLTLNPEPFNVRRPDRIP